MALGQQNTDYSYLKQKRLYLFGKRCFDLALCFPALLIFFPLLLGIGLAIKLNSPGPIFYRGSRSGLFCVPFRIFKFRTMVTNAEKLGGPSTALNDPRITKIGRFLRKYKLDELPQLLNILTGEMSFVGPRPQVEHYTKLYTGDEKRILHVKPGLTDYASIRFIHLDKILGDGEIDEKYRLEIEPEKNRLRIKYAKECSFLLDLKLIGLTLLQMLKVRSLWNIKN